MSITKVYIPDYELSYLEAKPESTAAAYSRQEIIWEDPKCFHEFLDLTAIWHDASEGPEHNCTIIYVTKNNKIGTLKRADKSRWDWYKEKYSILMWAYIADILPKGGK